MKRITFVSIALAMAVGLVGWSWADSYPQKIIRIVTPFAAGSTSDLVVRTIGPKLADSLGQQVIVDNRPGANGIIAYESVAKAAPDGYTILLISNGSCCANVSLYSKLPYDPVKDYAPITMLGHVPFFLVAGNNFPGNSVKELVALAKAHPGIRTLASKSSMAQLAGELFKIAAGVDMVHVPYKDAYAAFVDLSSGQLDVLVEPVPSSLSQVKAGRIKALAVASANRSVSMPTVPTIAESGYPGFEASAWIALAAPAGTPKEIIAKLNTQIVRILQTPEVKEKLLQSGVEVAGSTPEQLEELVKTEVAKWARVIKEAKIPKIN